MTKKSSVIATKMPTIADYAKTVKKGGLLSKKLTPNLTPNKITLKYQVVSLGSSAWRMKWKVATWRL